MERCDQQEFSLGKNRGRNYETLTLEHALTAEQILGDGFPPPRKPPWPYVIRLRSSGYNSAGKNRVGTGGAKSPLDLQFNFVTEPFVIVVQQTNPLSSRMIHASIPC